MGHEPRAAQVIFVQEAGDTRQVAAGNLSQDDIGLLGQRLEGLLVEGEILVSSQGIEGVFTQGNPYAVVV